MPPLFARLALLTLIALLPSLVLAQTSDQPVSLEYEVKPRANFTKAQFSFWVSTTAQPIRGVILLVPGYAGDGRGMVKDCAWQELAKKYGLALVGCLLQGDGYYAAADGTGEAVQEALKEFGQQSTHPELPKLPLVLYGESAGGQFNYNYVVWKPDLVLAFIVNKGAYYDTTAPSAHACAVPGLFILGKSDTAERIKNITDLCEAGRKRGALWALTPQPNSGHEFSKTSALARIFFDSVLKVRLPDASPGDPTPMNPMTENQGWTGDLTTFEIRDASTDNPPDRHAAWLPDQTAAEAWKAFVLAGS